MIAQPMTVGRPVYRAGAPVGMTGNIGGLGFVGRAIGMRWVS